MDTGKFTGFEVKLEKPGIAWIEFNEPEKLNGMNSAKTAVSDHHPDSREGVKAFGEKRDPHFNEWLREFE